MQAVDSVRECAASGGSVTCVGYHALHAFALCTLPGPTHGVRVERERATELQGFLGTVDSHCEDASIVYRHKSPRGWSYDAIQ